MYFYLSGGKQHVDFRGDLIISHNDNPIKARNKSAAPRYAHNANHICNVHTFSFWQKLKATAIAARFIWAKKSQALTKESIEDLPS